MLFFVKKIEEILCGECNKIVKWLKDNKLCVWWKDGGDAKNIKKKFIESVIFYEWCMFKVE